MHTLGYQADLAYNIALCYFKDKQYVPALKHAGELNATPRDFGAASPSGGPSLTASTHLKYLKQ